MLGQQAAKEEILQPSEINMHTITMVFCHKSSFSVLGFGKNSLAPLSWSKEKLFLVFSQGPRISDRYIHKNYSHAQYSPTVLEQEIFSPRSSFISPLLAVFSCFHTSFFKRVLLLAVQVSHASSPLSSFFCL